MRNSVNFGTGDAPPLASLVGGLPGSPKRFFSFEEEFWGPGEAAFALQEVIWWGFEGKVLVVPLNAASSGFF